MTYISSKSWNCIPECKVNFISFYKFLFIYSVFTLFFNFPAAQAYPIYAQQNYQNPREANGRIVCANCHLAQKPVEIEVPQAILPNTVFEAVVKIPYNCFIIISNF